MNVDKTPLHVAVETGNLEVTKCLEEHQETVRTETELQNLVSPETTAKNKTSSISPI
jgi:hypothetical protein